MTYCECGNTLTEEEEHYLDGRCQECERDWHEKIIRWRAGEKNPELDKVYSMQKHTLH